MENFVLINEDNKTIKYEDWVFMNKDNIDNIINKILDKLNMNSKRYKYVIDEENLIEELQYYLYETSNTKYKKNRFI
tara:strand:+ start:362 stop:592 length:231 start_codon:yes stop_codon:yes gene_type:complete